MKRKQVWSSNHGQKKSFNGAKKFLVKRKKHFIRTMRINRRVHFPRKTRSPNGLWVKCPPCPVPRK